MGRYYTGDIEGKFWFTVQRSDDADHFGVEGTPIYWDEEEDDEPYALSYTFTEEDLITINEGIEECLKVLGDYKNKLDLFFIGKETYTNEILCESIGCNPDDLNLLLENFARLDLGMKIKKCVEENGSCFFDADLG